MSGCSNDTLDSVLKGYCQLQFYVQDFYEVAKFDKRTKLGELMQDPERNPKERTLIFVQVKIGTLTCQG